MLRLTILTLVSLLGSFCAANDAIDPPKQLVLVTVPTTDSNQGTLTKYEKINGQWQQIGPSHDITIGANGVAWSDSPLAPPDALIKVEGDKRSPAGIFDLKQTFGRATTEKAKYVQMPYEQIGPNAQCIEDKSSAFYNQIVFDNTQVNPDWDQDDRMLRDDNLYDWGVFVEHNASQTPGKGSCIFIHIWRGEDKPTAGCTAMSKKHLAQLVYWLDPMKAPQLALMTDGDYKRISEMEDLPKIQ